MGRELSHDELAGLLGAYALDAVEPDEAAALAAHLERCPRCAAELSEHREVAGLIANAGVDAPPELWEQISARIGAARAASDGRVVLPGAPGRSSVASFSLSPASTRSSFTPGRSAVALPPGVINPDALATSAIVPFGVRR